MTLGMFLFVGGCRSTTKPTRPYTAWLVKMSLTSLKAILLVYQYFFWLLIHENFNAMWCTVYCMSKKSWPLYMVSYYTKLIKTSWIYSTLSNRRKTDVFNHTFIGLNDPPLYTGNQMETSRNFYLMGFFSICFLMLCLVCWSSQYASPFPSSII